MVSTIDREWVLGQPCRHDYRHAASRRGRRLVPVLAAALACAFAAYTASAVASPARSATTPTVELRQLVARDVRAGAPGVIVRVDDGGGHVIEIAEQAAWSRRDHVLTTADRFRMGSNTQDDGRHGGPGAGRRTPTRVDRFGSSALPTGAEWSACC